MDDILTIDDIQKIPFRVNTAFTKEELLLIAQVFESGQIGFSAKAHAVLNSVMLKLPVMIDAATASEKGK